MTQRKKENLLFSPLDDLRVEDWEEMIDVNLKGVLYGIVAVLPVFRTQGFGHFVNIASTAAYLVYNTSIQPRVYSMKLSLLPLKKVCIPLFKMSSPFSAGPELLQVRIPRLPARKKQKVGTRHTPAQNFALSISNVATFLHPQL